VSTHNGRFARTPGRDRVKETVCAMKTKTRHRKSYKWRKKADSSPIAKGRRPKRHGRNPRKHKHLGGAGL
jgi:hypothetical protein